MEENMTSVHQANPGIWCTNCGDPCRPHYIRKCLTCGGYICLACIPYHLCMPRDKKEVRKMKPEYVDYNVNKSV